MPEQVDLQVRNYFALHAMPPHMHDAPSMGIILRGGFEERIGNVERRYARGHVAYLPAGMIHSQRFGRAPTRQIIFQPDPDWVDQLADCGACFDDSPHLYDLAFCHLGEKLLRELREPDGFSVIACQGILLELGAAFARGYAASAQPRNPPVWLTRTRDYLHARACSPVRISELARTAGRHEVHVAREFRRYYGMSIGDYQRTLRIDSAALLLSRPRADISEIAFGCGFSSHSHLCRAFKRRYGITPSQYRAERSK
jgi:AraC family transcriptional regulator